MWKLSVTGVTVVALFAGGLFAAPVAQAQPAASCQGDGCINKDPIQAGCSGDAQTVAYYIYGQQQLQLRYSNTCKAAWARLVNAPAGTPFQAEEMSGGRVVAEVTYAIPPGYTTGYSNMVGDLSPSNAFACYGSDLDAGPCTLRTDLDSL